MVTTLHSFCTLWNCPDGAFPWAALVQATDGALYGTTYGIQGPTTVFKITLDGTLTTLHTFNGSDGSEPYATLVQGSDWNLYGTTTGGGAKGQGTIFTITPEGMLTTLHSFDGDNDGSSPNGLVQASNGAFYGTTYAGGPYNDGTVFELQVPLTDMLVVLTSGNGKVTSTDGFINCPGTCSHSYLSNTQVNLKATPGQRWFFGGWDGACIGESSCTVTMTESLSIGAVFSQPLQLTTVTPCRLLDTRTGTGASGPIQGGAFQTFTLPQLAKQYCHSLDLSAAWAYSLNVAVVPQGPLGYLTVWPAGQDQPVVSTLNSLDGRIKANADIVPAGAGAAISVFASNTTDVVIDIDGYFAPASQSTLAFYPLAPCRVADTRNPNGDLGGPYLKGQVPRDFPVLESACFPKNLNPAAYSFNFTAVPHGPLGYLTVWPAGQSQPVVSTLNALTGTVTANAAIVPAGTGGDIEVFASNDSDLVIDVNGYFAAPGQNGLSLYPVAPCRVLDTRQVGNGQPFSGELTVDVMGSPCAPPGTAQAYVFNATVVPSVPLGYLTLWPDDGSPPPTVATLNAVDGAVTSNMAIVPTTNGKINAFASNLTQLILDISSYFAP
jgi:uncharacterized repeat protein (TIGR03803 family)